MLAASVFVATMASLNHRQDLITQLTQELTEIHLLVKRSAQNHLLQNETLFRYLGQQIEEMSGDQTAINRLIDKSLANDRIVLAYGISDKNGKLIHVSENLRGKPLPNLLEAESSGRSFRKALESDRLVIGDSYYFKPLEAWLVPLRYAMRDSNGEVSLVITTGLSIDDDTNPWYIKHANDDLGITVTSGFYNDSSMYPIYYDPLILSDSKLDFYQKPLDPRVPKQVIPKVERAAGISFTEFMSREKPVAYINDMLYTEPALAVLSYDKQYNYFLGVRRPYTVINAGLQQYIGYIVLLVLTFNGLTFWVLRRDHRITQGYHNYLTTKARQDHLTSLPNRYALETTWQPTRRLVSDLAVFYIDLDNFRFINDHFGHAMGDKVLIEVARKLKSLQPEDTNLFRLGGDEFLYVTPVIDTARLHFLAEQILHRINEVILIDSIKISLTACIGVTVAKDEATLEALMVEADLAMVDAKKVRNSYSFHEDLLADKFSENLEIENQLATANLGKEIHVEYQPQISFPGTTLNGVEVLARWTNEKLGPIGPDSFIPLAEKTGKIIEIGEILIDRAFNELSRYPKLHSIASISLNISVHQLMYGRIHDFLNQKLREYELSTRQIKLEITESMFIEDLQYVATLIQDIRRDGYQISLDDFGTGYSSLSLIRTLAIDEIKIDKSFVDRILVNGEDRELIKSIIGIGNNLRIPVLAEGTESLAQVSMLREFGCECFQGYYFAKPMPIEELHEFVGNSQDQDLNKDSSKGHRQS